MCATAAITLAASALAAGEAGSKLKAVLSPSPLKQAVKDIKAHGLFTATLDGKPLRWKLTFAKLTGPATAAHIHTAATGKILIPLCTACKSGATGTITLTAVELRDFGARDLLYVNVHTAKNPGGEIRGQLGQG